MITIEDEETVIIGTSRWIYTKDSNQRWRKKLITIGEIVMITTEHEEIIKIAIEDEETTGTWILRTNDDYKWRWRNNNHCHLKLR